MNSIDWLIIIGMALGVTAIYLRLRAIGHVFDLLSGGLAGISFCLLAVSAAKSPLWWPEAAIESDDRQLLFWTCSVAAVLGAALMVTANDRRAVFGGVAMMSAGCCGVLAMNGLPELAVGLAVIGAMVVGVVTYFKPVHVILNSPIDANQASLPCVEPEVDQQLGNLATNSQSSRRNEHDDHHEPLLACVVGGVIGMVLLGSVRQATFEEAKHTVQIQSRKSLVSKRHTALPNANPTESANRPVPARTAADFALDVLPLGAAVLGLAAISGLYIRRLDQPEPESEPPLV